VTVFKIQQRLIQSLDSSPVT